MTHDDEKLNRAAVLGAGGATALAALLTAAGCGGKGGSSGSSTADANTVPCPKGSQATHPIHMSCQFQLGNNGLNSLPPTPPKTCTIIVCDKGTAPPPGLGSQWLKVDTDSALVNDATCDISADKGQSQTIFIYFS